MLIHTMKESFLSMYKNALKQKQHPKAFDCRMRVQLAQYIASACSKQNIGSSLYNIACWRHAGELDLQFFATIRQSSKAREVLLADEAGF